MFILTCELCPTVIFNLPTKADCIKSFSSGLKDVEKYTEHPSFQLRTLTIDLLKHLMEESGEDEAVFRPGEVDF